jgi:hypothetical protein
MRDETVRRSMLMMDDERKRTLIRQNNQVSAMQRANSTHHSTDGAASETTDSSTAMVEQVSTVSSSSSMFMTTSAVAAASAAVSALYQPFNSLKENRVMFADKSRAMGSASTAPHNRSTMYAATTDDNEEDEIADGLGGLETTSSDGRFTGRHSRTRTGSFSGGNSGGVTSLLSAWLGYTTDKHEEEDTTPISYVERLQNK